MSPTIIALVAALAAPVGAYLVAARRFSGKIETSDAKELWAESRDIRRWSKERIEALERRVDELDVGNRSLGTENQRLAEQVGDLNQTIKELREEIADLTHELKASRIRVDELEEEQK